MDNEHQTPRQKCQQPLSAYALKRQRYEESQRLARDYYNAIQQGDLDTLRRLRQQEFPKYFWGRRPLHVAVQTDNVATLSLLLEWGEEINGADDFGDSPLCTAVLGGHLKALEYLLQQGADPHYFGPNQMMGPMPVPGDPLLVRAVHAGEVPEMCAGLACLFDFRPDLLPEWERFLHQILVERCGAPEKERQSRRLVADALRQRGRVDLAAVLEAETGGH